MPDVSKSVTRRAFVQRWMRECGLTYSQACAAYETMCRVFGDGVVSASKIRVGRVGTIQPVWNKPREYRMGFKMGKDRTVTKSCRVFALGGRYTFKFKLYRQFLESQSLRWFLEEPFSS